MKEPSIGSGAACFLVYTQTKEETLDFIQELRNNGFCKWARGHGLYDQANWVYVNLNSKLFTPGMPGIKLTEPVGPHAITVEEFYTIYRIYEKYEGLSVFQFERGNHNA